MSAEAGMQESGLENRPYDRRTWLDAGLVVAAGLLLYGLNVDFLLRGDAAMYADYAIQGKFDELTLHIGYYLLIFAADRTVGALFGIPIHETMVWLNVVAGAATLGVAYLLARELLPTRRDALLCAILLAVCGRVIMNATTSEIYMVQTLLVLWSFLLFVRMRVVAAGAAAGFALLVSPLSAFAFLFYPVMDFLRAGRVRVGVLLRLAAACLVVYLPYFVLFGQELLWGRRGLLTKHGDLPYDPVEGLSNLPRLQFKHYTALLLLMIPALAAVRSYWRLLVVSLAVAVPHLYLLLKLTSEDNVFILTTDFFFACWLVVGWRTLARSPVGARVAPVFLTAHVVLYAVSGALIRFDSNRGYAQEMREIARTHVVGRDAALASDWDGVMTLTYFGRPEVTTTIEREPLFRQMVDIGMEIRPGALDAAEIYLLDTWSPGPLRRFLSSDSALARTQRRMSVAARADRLLQLDCDLIRTGTHPLYRCSRRAGISSTPIP